MDLSILGDLQVSAAFISYQPWNYTADLTLPVSNRMLTKST